MLHNLAELIDLLSLQQIHLGLTKCGQLKYMDEILPQVELNNLQMNQS
jgi:hypothetical protein